MVFLRHGATSGRVGALHHHRWWFFLVSLFTLTCLITLTRAEMIGGKEQPVTIIAGYDPINSTDAKGNLLYFPGGMFVKDGEVFIADSGHNRIKRRFANGTIVTIAGTGGAGYNSDGILAINAQLSNPQAVFVHSNGEVYIVDTNNHRIRKIDGRGYIWTVAGTGQGGYNGDGGLATSAQLNYPLSVCINSYGDVYIADTMNNRIRTIDWNGNIWTIAGNGEFGISGDGVLATSAPLIFPRSVLVLKTGQVYFAEIGLREIGKDGYISTKTSTTISKYAKENITIAGTGIITTIAGTGTGTYSGDGGMATSAELNGPQSVFVHSNGEIYIADSVNNRIRKIDSKGIITTIAGTGSTRGGYSGDGGLATSAELNYPRSVFVHTNSEVYIIDDNNNRIRKIDSNGIITTIAGNGLDSIGRGGYSGDGGLAIYAQLNYPRSVFVHSNGEIYIADSGNNRIRKIDSKGIITTVAGTGLNGYSGDGGLATSAAFSPESIFVRSNGEIYIADTGNRIRKYPFKWYYNNNCRNRYYFIQWRWRYCNKCYTESTIWCYYYIFK